jgi:hypothetical protein
MSPVHLWYTYIVLYLSLYSLPGRANRTPGTIYSNYAYLLHPPYLKKIQWESQLGGKEEEVAEEEAPEEEATPTISML